MLWMASFKKQGVLLPVNISSIKNDVIADARQNTLIAVSRAGQEALALWYDEQYQEHLADVRAMVSLEAGLPQDPSAYEVVLKTKTKRFSVLTEAEKYAKRYNGEIQPVW